MDTVSHGKQRRRLSSSIGHKIMMHAFKIVSTV
jgi:hypothetical protein